MSAVEAKIPVEAKAFYDAIVIGGGPAGLTAAVYLARASCRVVVVEKEAFGGQIRITNEVVNYPGTNPLSGKELTDRIRAQADRFGAEFLLANVTQIQKNGDFWEVETSRGKIAAFGVILATGAHPRLIGFTGEQDFQGRGVAYCATCDGEFYTGKDIFVIGGGFAAAEEGVFLTRYARSITMLVREEDFTCPPEMAKAAREHEKITVHYNATVESVSGDEMVRKLVWKDTKTGEEHTFAPEDGDSFGVFVFAGYVPSTDLIKGLAELDKQGYALTDRNQKTSVEGLYAAGDVCQKNLRQVVTATGDGAVAATELEKYIHKMEEQTGIHAEKIHRAPVHTPRDSGTDSQPAKSGDDLFSPEVIAQLESVFSRMENPLVLELSLTRGDALSDELRGYMERLAAMTDKISLETKDANGQVASVRVLRADASPTGLAFHGVPGGHEFTSFVLGLYNASGPGQSVSPEDLERINKLSGDIHMSILVSLSCTNCPGLVISAQRIASLSPHVTTDVYDINHFVEFKEKYQVMSVPCFIISQNGKEKKPAYGRKNIEELLSMLEAS